MKCPTMKEVKDADRYHTCLYHRFVDVNTAEEAEIMSYNFDRYCDVGGFTPELSKAIGWDPR